MTKTILRERVKSFMFFPEREYNKVRGKYPFRNRPTACEHQVLLGGAGEEIVQFFRSINFLNTVFNAGTGFIFAKYFTALKG